MGSYDDVDEYPDDVLLDNLEVQYERDDINGDMMFALLNRWHHRVTEAEAERDRLRVERDEFRELCGEHDPTGGDHMQEMMEHANRADAAEAERDRLRVVVETWRRAKIAYERALETGTAEEAEARWVDCVIAATDVATFSGEAPDG